MHGTKTSLHDVRRQRRSCVTHASLFRACCCPCCSSSVTQQVPCSLSESLLLLQGFPVLHSTQTASHVIRRQRRSRGAVLFQGSLPLPFSIHPP